MPFPEHEIKKLQELHGIGPQGQIKPQIVRFGETDGSWFCGSCGAQGNFKLIVPQGIVSLCACGWPGAAVVAKRRADAGLPPLPDASSPPPR